MADRSSDCLVVCVEQEKNYFGEGCSALHDFEQESEQRSALLGLGGLIHLSGCQPIRNLHDGWSS